MSDFRNESLNRMLGRGTPVGRSAADEKTPLDRFRQRIQEASIENMERRERLQEQEQRARERAMNYWNEAQNETSNQDSEEK